MLDSFKAYGAGILLMAVAHQYPDHTMQVSSVAARVHVALTCANLHLR